MVEHNPFCPVAWAKFCAHIMFLCACVAIYRHQLVHQHHTKRPHLFWAMAHYIDQPAPWDPNDLVLYVVVRPDPQTPHVHSCVLHYESGWQTWIPLPPGFQEEHDPRNWELLHMRMPERGDNLAHRGLNPAEVLPWLQGLQGRRANGFPSAMGCSVSPQTKITPATMCPRKKNMSKCSTNEIHFFGYK